VTFGAWGFFLHSICSARDLAFAMEFKSDFKNVVFIAFVWRFFQLK
jgi:hypothetical protein